MITSSLDRNPVKSKIYYTLIICIAALFLIVSVYFLSPDKTGNDTLVTLKYNPELPIDSIILFDKPAYSWTDEVHITIVSPDHNFDSEVIDTIGHQNDGSINVGTRGYTLYRYTLAETGPDTGIFAGFITLTGFSHDADGDTTTGNDARGVRGSDTYPKTGSVSGTKASGLGPTDGLLQTDGDGGITVSFESTDDKTIVRSVPIQWNIGESFWSESAYAPDERGVLRVVDADMNLSPTYVDKFDVDVWSDVNPGGIKLTVLETDANSGIFEGSIPFTTTDESSSRKLRVAEGDTITADYVDHTLPQPYTTSDEKHITTTSQVITLVPPLFRAPISSLYLLDYLGNPLDDVSRGMQLQVTSAITSGQSTSQEFAYIVYVKDSNGQTISLAWITGTLLPDQEFEPSLSWTPESRGTFTVTAFVWESLNTPVPLSEPAELTVTVS